MQQGVRFESPGMGKARRVMALLPLSINAFDAERCDQRAHVTVQLALAEMPELNWQRAAQAPEHVDAHPGIREHPDATTANHDAPALETAEARGEDVLAGGAHSFACRASLLARQIPSGSAVKVTLDTANDFGTRDEVHAAWQTVAHIDTKMFPAIALVIIAQWQTSRPPAAAAGAARQRANRMDELVSGIGLPMRGLAPAGDHDAGADRVAAAPDGHGRGQVHQAGNAAEDALRVMDQQDQLAQGGAAP